MWVPEYHMLRGRAKGSALFIANWLHPAFFPDMDGPSLPGESHLGLGPQSTGIKTPRSWHMGQVALVGCRLSSRVCGPSSPSPVSK